MTLLLADAPQPPSEIYGALFGAVQLARVFPDGKTFADAIPKRAPADILANYTAQKPAETETLRTFVLANFALPAVVPATPPAEGLPLAEHIASL